MMTPILDTHKTLMCEMRFPLQKQKLQKRKGQASFYKMRYEFVDDVVLSPVAVKGLPEEAWERAESSRRVGTTCLVLRDDHSQEGVVIDYVTTLTTGWDRSLIIYYVTTPYREYDEHHMWIAASEEIQARFTESWWQIRMSHQVMEKGN
jgi:hypothetical protein